MKVERGPNEAPTQADGHPEWLNYLFTILGPSEVTQL
jgi:hypothetical protein